MLALVFAISNRVFSAGVHQATSHYNFNRLGGQKRDFRGSGAFKVFYGHHRVFGLK